MRIGRAFDFEVKMTGSLLAKWDEVGAGIQQEVGFAFVDLTSDDG